MQKKFLVSVMNATLMQGNDIILTAKTLLDSSVSLSTTANELRGGKGNQLQMVYYHSGTLNITLTDAQFRLPYLALNTGSAIVNGGDIWTNETVVLNGTTGTITGTPVAIDGQPISVWVEYNGTNYTIPVTGQTFSVSSTDIPANSTLCVAYRVTESGAQTITIPANFQPDRCHLFLDGDLYGDSTGNAKVGSVHIDIPLFQLSGNEEISLTADGYANSPLSGMALAYNDAGAVGCSNGAYYAKITEYITGTDQFADVIGLSIEQGDFSMDAGDTATLRVWAIRSNNSAFLCKNADLSFESSNTNFAEVGQHTGVVTAVAEGDVLLTAYITTKPSIEASCTVTVTEA